MNNALVWEGVSMKKREKSKKHPEWTKEEILLIKLILTNESELCQLHKEKLIAILSQ